MEIKQVGVALQWAIFSVPRGIVRLTGLEQKSIAQPGESLSTLPCSEPQLISKPALGSKVGNPLLCGASVLGTWGLWGELKSLQKGE
jgi:hypothetical protein